MKKINFCVLIFLLSLTSCSTSQKWSAVKYRDPAAVEKTDDSFHRLETNWGEMIIRIGTADKSNKTPVTLEVINHKANELEYKRDFINFLSLDKSNIKVVSEFADPALVSEDDQTSWSKLPNKLIPNSPLQTRTIAGVAVIKKGYFVKDTIYIDSQELLRHDRLSVVISNELIKSKDHASLEFTASK